MSNDTPNTATHTSDTPQLLLEHHLKELRLPTMLREYDHIARQCAVEQVDYQRYAPIHIHEIQPSGVPRTLPQRQMFVEQRSEGGLLLLRRKTPLPRCSVVYFCSGAHTIEGIETVIFSPERVPCVTI